MDNKIKIFGIGISGLVGTQIQEVLKDKYVFDNLSLDTGVNITDASTLDVIRNDTDHAVVLHLAAKADVDGCEKDKEQGEAGAAYQINVGGTQNVVDACKPTNKKIIYISTDFIFDGENTPEGGYTEESTPRPLNWYAETKYKGEEVVKASGIPYLITRIAYPYRTPFPLKKDFVNAILDRLRQNLPVAAVTDHMMTPTFVDDIALGLDKLIETDSTGIFHVVGRGSISPYDAAMTIADVFGCDKSLITKTTREQFFAGRAPRPFNLSLNNAKIEKLGVTMKSFTEGLQVLKNNPINK